MRSLWFLFFFIFSVLGKSLSSDLKRCSKSDPEFNKCLDIFAMEFLRKFADGNKDLGIAPLEPLFIEKVDLGNTTSGSASLHQIYTNMKIHGISKGIMKDSDAKFDKDNAYWDIKYIAPVIRMESDYTMKGQLSIFPINGYGKCNNTFYDVESHFGYRYERYTKNGITYLRITHSHFMMRPKKVVFNFDNLIDGNELLSEEVLKVINEDANAVYAEIGPYFDQVMDSIWLQTISKFLKIIPEDELFLP